MREAPYFAVNLDICKRVFHIFKFDNLLNNIYIFI
jgi:hypothetical protein